MKLKRTSLAAKATIDATRAHADAERLAVELHQARAVIRQQQDALTGAIAMIAKMGSTLEQIARGGVGDAAEQAIACLAAVTPASAQPAPDTAATDAPAL